MRGDKPITRQAEPHDTGDPGPGGAPGQPGRHRPPKPGNQARSILAAALIYATAPAHATDGATGPGETLDFTAPCSKPADQQTVWQAYARFGDDTAPAHVLARIRIPAHDTRSIAAVIEEIAIETEHPGTPIVFALEVTESNDRQRRASPPEGEYWIVPCCASEIIIDEPWWWSRLVSNGWECFTTEQGVTLCRA